MFEDENERRSTLYQLIRCVVCQIYSKDNANRQLARRNVRYHRQNGRYMRRFRRTHRHLIQDCLNILRPQVADGTLTNQDHLYEQRATSSSAIDIIIRVVSDCMERRLEGPIPPLLIRTNTEYFGLSAQIERDCSLSQEELAVDRNIYTAI